jgi:hypothetical protein
MTGQVEKFAEISQTRLRLQGLAGDEIKSTVTIKPKEKYPFRIVESRARKGTDIRFKLEEVKNEKGPEYLLTVENLKTEKGRYADTIFLKTDSTLKPKIEIYVSGIISEKGTEGQQTKEKSQ